MIGQLLVVSIAGRRVALPTAEILSVIELESLVQVPRAPTQIAGLTALRSRVLTVIDCACIVDGKPSPRTGANGLAVVINIDDHGYALMVEDVQDVTTAADELDEVMADLGGNWSGCALGMAETEIGPLLVVDPASLVIGNEAEKAA